MLYKINLAKNTIALFISIVTIGNSLISCVNYVNATEKNSKICKYNLVFEGEGLICLDDNYYKLKYSNRFSTIKCSIDKYCHTNETCIPVDTNYVNKILHYNEENSFFCLAQTDSLIFKLEEREFMKKIFTLESGQKNSYSIALCLDFINYEHPTELKYTTEDIQKSRGQLYFGIQKTTVHLEIVQKSNLGWIPYLRKVYSFGELPILDLRKFEKGQYKISIKEHHRDFMLEIE